MSDILIPDEIIEEMIEANGDSWKKVRTGDPFVIARQLASGYKSIYNTLIYYFGERQIKSLKILEVGSGNSFSLCYAIRIGLNIVGIEPGGGDGFIDNFARGIRLLKVNNIRNPEKFLYNAIAEDLPFEDNSFDTVLSIAVLEHVQDVEKAMGESIRVLKPGGILIANVPSYNSIYEGHYNIPWIPYMNKRIAKLYVKIWGRDPSYIDGLTFIAPGTFKRYLNSRETYGIITFDGISFFKNSFSNYVNTVFGRYNYLSRNNTSEKNTLSNKIYKIKIKILARLFILLGFSTIFNLIIKKRAMN